MESKVLSIQDGVVEQGKTVVLKDVSLELGEGEFTYLIGKTGTGKSSLLKILYGELTLTGGKGSIAGFDLLKLKRKQIPMLRRKLGIVFQDFQLLTDRSVYKNLSFVMRSTGWKDRKKMNDRIDEVLEMVGLASSKHKMPHALSGGEQQRIVIARALVNHPEIILADEPTGNLDPETSEEILRLLLKIASEGTAVLMATHDFGMMEKFPKKTYKCEDQTVKVLNPVSDFNPFNPGPGLG